MSTNLMTGAQVVLECLLREKVDTFFGYPGGVTLPLYDALYDHPIKHILVRHEQNACFAAQGYARATGKVGVCCATSGPGATNLVTALSGRADGFDSRRGDHRAGIHQADRQRRVSGSRHVRHHALLHQAQFHGEEIVGASAGHPRSVSHRGFGPARSGAGGYSQRRVPGPGPLHAGFDHSPAGLSPNHGRPRRTDPARS